MARHAPAKSGPTKPGPSQPGPRPAPGKRAQHPVLALQQAAGNRAVGRLIEARKEERKSRLDPLEPEVSPEATPRIAAREAEAEAPAKQAAPVKEPAGAAVEPPAPAATLAAAPANAPVVAPVAAAPEPAAVEAAPAVSAESGGSAAPAVPEASAEPALVAPEIAPKTAPEAASAAPPPTGEGAPPAPAPEAGAAAPAPEPAGEQAPTSPEQDPAFQAVVARIEGVARQKKSHVPARAAAAKAQAAAVDPPNAASAHAAGAQVGKMDAQQPRPFDRAAFKAALLAKVASVTPQTLEAADEFKSSGKAGDIKTAVTARVAAGKDQAQGAIQKAATETPSPGGFHPRPASALAPPDPGPPPPDLAAGQAAPKPKSEAEIEAPLAASSQRLDEPMTAAGVTEAQLERSNEPAFQDALQAKREAQDNASQAPAAYRAAEKGTLAVAAGQARTSARDRTAAMHGARGTLLAQVAGRQLGAKAADEQRRAEVARRIEGMYQTTRGEVEARLSLLDRQVQAIFDRGAGAARRAFEDHVAHRMAAYKEKRYKGVKGLLRWGKDKLFGMPSEVNAFYVEGRDLYVRTMDGTLDEIATTVESGLLQAKALIAVGRQQTETYVAGLPGDLQQVGREAADGIQARFAALEQSVADKQGQLVEDLARKYAENLQQVDARVTEMKEADRGLADKAGEALGGVLRTLAELKEMLFSVLARAAGVIGTILQDPIGFLGHLVDGVRLGLSGFVSNLGEHLKKGVLEWLFGALGEAGLQIPESFDLKGILGLILQVLGLTYVKIRARAVAIVGEPVVSALEKTAEVFKILVTEGPAGLWRFIQDKLAEIKETVLEGLKSFLMESVIKAGITWLLSLLNPVAAFIKACKAIYDIVMFFVTRAAQVMALVSSILDSIAAIASGAIAEAAAAVEKALAKTIPVVIGFLASLLGLGGISDKIREVIQAIQAPINKAVDAVIHQAVKTATAVGGLFSGGKKKEEKPVPETGDLEHDAKVAAGLAAIDVEEAHYPETGITQDQAERVAAKVQAGHPVFKSLAVVDSGESWDYDYVASPGRRKRGARKSKQPGRTTALSGRPAEEAVSNATGVPLNVGTGRDTIPGSGPGRVRFPDLKIFGLEGSIIQRGSIIEVKDVKRLQGRRQIRDLIAYARSKSLVIEIYSDASIPSRGVIADAVATGLVVLKGIPKR